MNKEPNGRIQVGREAANGELEVVRRRIFVCIHCKGIYVDYPVTQCDCLEGSGHDFVEGIAEYKMPTPNAKINVAARRD